ncbi:MAG TPA: ubiquitin carboxyl-terminal hydrolase family protein [Saprospiraceae bacterium]|nr:ubiquitin carboxyl-terminal hydrolase family protein [Saprospiraceae bacterium]
MVKIFYIDMEKYKQIMEKRLIIKKYAIKNIFEKKGGRNFKSLNGSDIEKIFNMYDNNFFDGEIMKRITKDVFLIEFKASKRTSGVGGITGYETDQPITFYIDIAPNILETIFRSESVGIPAAAGVDGVCKDRLGCLLLIIEHQIIHLIMMLWGYSNVGPFTPKAKRTGDEIYGPHGRLFQCLSNRFFGHSNFSHDLGIADISDISGSPSQHLHFQKYLQSKGKGSVITPKGLPLNAGGYKNWSASCYLDSVLIILFYGASNFWRDVILGKESLDTEDKLAIQVKEQLEYDYDAMRNRGETIKCSKLRSFLLKRVPDLKQNTSWVIYNAGAAYEAIVNIIPNFLIDIPIQIHRFKRGTYKADSVKYVREAMLTFWDYMDPLTDIESGKDYKKIRWDLIQSPILVFTNGGAPRIKKLNETSEEKGETYIMGKKHKFKVNKARKFGKTIIDGRYDLIGVVVLQGVSEKKEGGSHYISYFKDDIDQWFKYNDMSASIKKINDIPQKGVWVEEGGSMPSMYFYRKTSNKPKIESSPWVMVPPTELSIGESTSEDSPVQKSLTKSSKTLEGSEIDYRRIDRQDGYTLVYIKDKTFAKTKIGKFKNLLEVTPQTTRTMLEPNLVMWRVPTTTMKGVERKIAKILKA